MGYLIFGVTSTAAEGARLFDLPYPPTPTSSISVDPLIVVAAAAILVAILVARWGGFFTRLPGE